MVASVNMMPLFHVGGIVRNLLAPIMSGGSVVMCAGFDPVTFWNLSARIKVTWYVRVSFLFLATLLKDVGITRRQPSIMQF